MTATPAGGLRVLLISHEASRTGAPRIAALVAKCLVQQGHSVKIVTRAPGPMLPDFEQAAPTSVEFLYRVRRRLWRITPIRLIALAIDTVLAGATLLWRRPDVVYVNSTSAAIYLRPALWMRKRVVLHVHESGEVAGRFLRGARASRLLTRVSCVACSPSVRAGLAGLIGGNTDIAVLPSVPDETKVLQMAGKPPDHWYSPEEFVVGCCGSVEHRKGADLWVEVARRVRDALPDERVRFRWVGEAREPVPQHDPDRVDFTGPTANPYAHMKRFDIATLPSRDDPFPLVVLEAMLLGTPVVAFAVGSVAEQIGDAGVTVPPGDVAAFAAAVVRLLTDRAERERLGRAAQARVHTLYSTAAFAAGLVAVVDPSASHRTGRGTMMTAPGPREARPALPSFDGRT